MNAKYIHHFFSLNSAENLVPFFKGCKKRAAKEVTESFAMLYATDLLPVDRTDPDVRCVIVGDGRFPRTGAVLAFMTKWYIYSIDPNFSDEAVQLSRAVSRLYTYKCKVEDIKIDLWRESTFDRKNILILPHSHAPFDACLDLFEEFPMIVSMPCCHGIPDKYLQKEYNVKVYSDPAVWSPKRTIYVWGTK